MKVELLTLLTAKSMNYEVSSPNHDAITAQDIAAFLGSRGLNTEEYDFLIAKYTDNNYARAMFFDDIFVDCAEIFIKDKKDKLVSSDKLLVRAFVNLAISEVMDNVCPFCLGRGSVTSGDKIVKCEHCQGTGQFIYDDNNRYEIMGYDKKGYMEFKKQYMKVLEKIKDIENSALSKIGDES